MAKEPKFRKDGEPDGRGRSDGSRAKQFSQDDGRPRPGRPKGSVNLATIYRMAAELKVTVKIGNRTHRISTAEGIILKQREKALGGDLRAGEKFLERVAQYSPADIPIDLTAELLEEDQRLLADAKARGVFEAQPNFPPPLPPASNREGNDV